MRLTHGIFFGLALVIAANGFAQTRTVEATIDVAAAPADVIDAFLEADGLSGWWLVSRSLVERRVGGVWSISWDDWGEEKTQHAWTGVIETLTPTRVVIARLVMNEPDRPLFGPLTLEIVADPIPGGSRVTVRHGGYRTGGDWDWMHDTVVRRLGSRPGRPQERGLHNSFYTLVAPYR